MNKPASIDSAHEEQRIAALLRQVPLEFARVVYGLNDLAHGRTDTAVAQEVTQTELHGAPVTRDRAEQRARAYLPVAGQEHCPHCWVFSGVKSPLHFREASPERAETATCRVCGAEYCSAFD